VKPGRPWLISSLFAALFLVLPRSAAAQTHWDANLHGGVSTRFFSQVAQSAGVSNSVGPLVGVDADVALIPLVRLGAYVDLESAHTGEPKSPQALTFGARVKLAPPMNFNHWHFWGFLGFGYAFWNAPAYNQSCTIPSGSSLLTETCNIQATTGSFFEIPLGVGAGWRFRRPWELIVELQGRFGLDMQGGYFTNDGSGNGLTRPATAPGTGLAIGPTTGTDVFALLLTVGIGLDQ
jgi:hypothetical protein